MYEDIKQLIDEEAPKHTSFRDAEGNNRDKRPYLKKIIEIQRFKEGANFILSKWQESEKWRKVEDELPEVDDHLQHSIISLLVKCESGIYKTAVYHSSGRWLEPETELDVNNVIEWKPIT